MPSAAGPSPPRLQRTSTWPPSSRVVTGGKALSESPSASLSAPPESGSALRHFEDDLEDHPENHFLSLMGESSDDWADDSDGEAEEVQWMPAIIDFALFDSDRRRAQEEHGSLPSKWTGFLSEQESALKRAVERNQTDAKPDTTRPPLPFEEVPDLTPDNSPQQKDDQDVNSLPGPSSPRHAVPNYLTATLDLLEEQSAGIDVSEDLPLAFFNERANKRKRDRPKLKRPGLQHNRTLSGRVHVWRRPSRHIYPVGEDPDAERRAELSIAHSVDDGRIERRRR